MPDAIVDVLTLLTALGSGLIAGVFFAFSNFVMQALGRLPAAHGAAAMQSINVTVLNPVFLGVFAGTALLCAILAGFALLVWSTASPYLLGGALLYLAGTFLVTVMFNVPRNEVLAKVDPAAPDASSVWASYLRSWTRWNHVRTCSALVAAALFASALA